MTSVFDFPYPWSQRVAQQLHITLTEIYPTGRGAADVAERVEIKRYKINADQPAIYVWKEILDEAANAQVTRDLVQEVSEQNPRNPSRPFFDDLLAGNPVEVDMEPRGQFGESNFIVGSDEIMEKEALLFQKDLTIQVGQVPALIDTLQQLVTLSPAVCKLSVSVPEGTGYGTAFRIGPDLLLTNWHVLHDDMSVPPARATIVNAEFRYEDDGLDGFLAPVPIACDVDSIISNREDDWAVIRAKQPLSDDWPIIKLSEAKDPKEGDFAFIVQHPGGQRKRVGFVRNNITSLHEQVVHYLTDTQPGSSGSPVFDGSGRLVALHHAGGTPQEVLGKPPMIKNEGIRISRVKEGLNQAGIAFA